MAQSRGSVLYGSRERVLYGVPGLVVQAGRGFEAGGDDLVLFKGIRIGGMGLYLPKDRENEILCRLRLRCEKSNEVFETCGYVSDDFAYEAFQYMDVIGIVTVADQELSRRPLKGTVQYHLLVELIEDSSPF